MMFSPLLASRENATNEYDLILFKCVFRCITYVNLLDFCEQVFVY